MKFHVESWAPEMGSPFEAAARLPGEVAPAVEVDVERPAAAWAPLGSPLPAAASVLFLDGVRRIDARLWIERGDATVAPGLCGSWAAGAVRCDGRAEVVACRVTRGVFAAVPAAPIATRHGRWLPEPVDGDQLADLTDALQRALRRLDVEVTESAAGAELVVVDGSLRGRRHVAGIVGYVKTHWAAYLPPELSPVVAALAPGERTPLFRIATDWSRLSWYLRLPGGAGHPWAGVVRCEVTDALTPEEAGRVADLTAASLPAFAAARHKDPRAPQNLVPIGGLESHLRRRLGDPLLLERSLRQVAGRR